MNKKILTSLLMTPLAFGAMADIPPVATDLQKSDGWTQTGISGDTKVFTDAGVRCPIEAGQLTRTLENLRPGKYKLVFKNADNVKASVDGAVCVKDEADTNVMTFTVPGDVKKTVTLVIEADKAGGFGFDALQIDFGFDFEAAVADFNSQLPVLPKVENSKSALLQSADYKEVTDKVNAIKELIAKLEDEKTQLEAYDNFQLWKYEAGEDLISTAIKQLTVDDKDKVETVITKINQVNEVAKLQTKINNYKTIFNKALAAIPEDYKYKKEVDAYAGGVRDAKAAEMQGMIDALESKVVNAATPISAEDLAASKKEVEDKLDNEYTPEIYPVANNIYVNDAKAYYDMVAMYDSLKDTYTKDLGAIIALQGVKGEFEDKTPYDYADDFNALSTQWQEELKGYFATAETAIAEATGATKGEDGKYVFNGGEAIKDAAGKIEAVKAVVDDMMNVQMEGCTLDCQQTVETQNAEMLKAITAIHEQEILIPETLPAKLAEEAATLKEQLATLLNAVVDKYAVLELPVENFDEQIEEIAAKIEKLAPATDLNKAYDELAKYIDENVNNPKDTKVENVIKGRFDKTLEAIKASMDALGLGDDTAEVLQSINDTNANAEKLVEAQANAWKALQDYKKFLDDLDTKFKNLQFVKGVTEEEKAAVAEKSGYKSLYDTYKQYKADFDAVLADDPNNPTVSNQEAYDKLVKVSENLKNVQIEEPYDLIAMLQYVDEVMALNKGKVEAKFTEVAKAGEGEYFGKDAVDEQLTEIKTDLDAVDIKNAITQDNLDKVDEVANGICKTLNEILTSLENLEPDIAQYKANQKWADGQVETLMGLLEKIEAAKGVNKDTSWTPATEYFDKLAQDYINAVGGLVDPDTENGIQAALEEGIAEKAKEVRDNVQDQVEKLVADVNGLSDRITKNHEAYTNLLEIAESTRNAIESAQNTLKSNMDTSGLTAEAPQVKIWQASVDSLLNNGKDMVPVGLTELNRQLGEKYGTGVAKDNESALKEQYDKLVSKAAALEGEINDGIGGAVAAANSLYLTQWITTYNALRDEYKTTLDAFNAYGSAKITNADYYQYLLEHVVIGDVKVLGDHQPIYEYSSDITELDKAVRDYIRDTKVAIGNDEYAAKAAPAADLTKGMAGMVTDMQTQAVNAATAYFVDVIAKNAQAIIDEAKADMIAKGCTEAIAAEAVEVAEQRMATWDKFLSIDDDVVLQVNYIANDAENIPGDIDKEAAAAATWAEAYNADTAQLAEWAKEIKEVFNSKASEDLTKFNDAKAAIDAMSNESLDTLKDNLAALGEQFAAAEEAYKALKNVYDTDTTTKEFNDTIVDLREDNDALNEYAEGLAGNPADVDIAGKIDAIDEAVKNSEDILADKEKIDGMVGEVEDAIANGYTSLVKSENNKLDGLMAKVFDAYQAVLEAEKFDDETAKAKRTALDELQKRIDDLFTANENGIEDKEDYKTKAQALETELANELANLQSMVKGESEDLTNALTALNEKYEAAYAAVEAGKAALDSLGLVKDEYAPRYDDLKKELEDIAAAVDAKGSAVILYQDAFASQIDAVVAELEALNAEAADAQKAAEEKAAIAEVTKANVEALNAELEAARTAREAAKTQVTEWAVEEWNANLGNLDGRIEAIEDDIEAQGTITEENADGLTDAEKTELSEAIASLYTEMNYYVEMAAMMYAEDANQATNKAISDARKALDGTTVVNSAALSDSIGVQATALEKAYNKLLADVEAAEGEAKVEAYESFAETAKAIQGEVEAIINEIKENTYILGDVDGNGGEPDAADLMTLVGWIGQGATIDDIKAKDGVAIAAALDVTGDGTLNISDATALIQLIKTDAGQRPARIVAARSAEGDAIYALTRTGEEAGSRIYSLSLNNSGDFIGAQVDIKLPIGMTLVDARMTERASGHDVQVFDNGNGNYRLVIFSMENAAFEGNAGELVNLTIEGIGTPVVEEMILSTPAHAAVLGHAADTNMIESIIEGAHNMKERIYNAAGQSLRAVQRGINIIRHSDGSTTKELHK